MGKKDPRVDDYIARSAEFAQPILERLRAIVHEACPEVEETLKWSMPAFVYHGILCGMASHKHHCTFGFWKGSMVTGDDARATEAMGQFGRITKLSDLPAKRVISIYVKKAMKLNEQGVRVPTPPKRTKAKVVVPADLRDALEKNRKAKAAFEAFSPSHRREYIEWITEAKRDETRKRRLATTLEWLAEGKPRHWKYL